MANKTPTPPKQGVRARERNALQRIEQLEQDLMNLAQGAQNGLNSLQTRINQSAEILDAVVGVLGKETVEAAVEQARAQVREDNAKAAKEALEAALKDGKLAAVPGDVGAGDKSILTGVEYDKDGKPVHPGYVQLAFASVKPEYQEKLRGKGVGFKFETEVGSFEVTGVYDHVTQPEPEEAPAQEPVTVEQAQ